MCLYKHFDVGVIRAAASPGTSSDIIEVFYHPGRVCGRQFSNSVGVQKQAFGGLSWRKSTPTFGTVSLVSALWSLFEVATDVLLFMQSKTTEATSRALCDPHSADLKVLLAAKFNRGQKYTEGMAVSSRQLILCSQSVKILTTYRYGFKKDKKGTINEFSICVICALMATGTWLCFCFVRSLMHKWNCFDILPAAQTNKQTHLYFCGRVNICNSQLWWNMQNTDIALDSPVLAKTDTS